MLQRPLPPNGLQGGPSRADAFGPCRPPISATVRALACCLRYCLQARRPAESSLGSNLLGFGIAMASMNDRPVRPIAAQG